MQLKQKRKHKIPRQNRTKTKNKKLYHCYHSKNRHHTHLYSPSLKPHNQPTISRTSIHSTTAPTLPSCRPTRSPPQLHPISSPLDHHCFDASTNPITIVVKPHAPIRQIWTTESSTAERLPCSVIPCSKFITILFGSHSLNRHQHQPKSN